MAIYLPPVLTQAIDEGLSHALTMESEYCEKGTLIPVLKMVSQNPEK